MIGIGLINNGFLVLKEFLEGNMIGVRRFCVMGEWVSDFVVFGWMDIFID